MSDLMINGLMDLANYDTSELNPLMSRLTRTGIYFLEIAKAGFTEVPKNDPADPQSFRLGFDSNILEWFPLKEEDGVGVDKAKIIGTTFKESYFLDGKGVMQAIQLLMGQYKSVGMRCKGAMGGMEGQAAGWIDEAIGKRILVRVTHRTGNDGVERANIYWMNPKQMKKLGIPFESLGRDFLDEQGNPVELDKVA